MGRPGLIKYGIMSELDSIEKKLIEAFFNGEVADSPNSVGMNVDYPGNYNPEGDDDLPF